MNSFLITFKPATESPEQGWPLENLQALAKLNREGKRTTEFWRFHNKKDVSTGDRVFLLLQGKGGPAIIGYGKLAGEPNRDSGKMRAEVQFESLTDPESEVLAGPEKLAAIPGAKRFWRTQSSGVKLTEHIAAALESLVVGNPPKLKDKGSDANPDWARDELILALDFYLRYSPNPPGKGSPQIAQLSKDLNHLGEKLFPPEKRAHTFRNENGVYMKLMNFRRLDPQFLAQGKKELSRGAKAEKEVWDEFASDPAYCTRVAEAIKASLNEEAIDTTSVNLDLPLGIQEAAEGRLLTKVHLVRERDPRLVRSKLRQAEVRSGKLVCEVCGFQFVARYGDYGRGYIECHHTKALHTLCEGYKSKLDDLALVCSNCHRMIHRRRQWLTLDQLRNQLR